LEFNVPFQHKYGYIRDDISSVILLSCAEAICLEALPDIINDWNQVIQARYDCHGDSVVQMDSKQQYE